MEAARGFVKCGLEGSLDAECDAPVSIPSYLYWVTHALQAKRFGHALRFLILKGMRVLQTTAQAVLGRPARNQGPAGHNIDGDLQLLSFSFLYSFFAACGCPGSNQQCQSGCFLWLSVVILSYIAMLILPNQIFVK